MNTRLGTALAAACTVAVLAGCSPTTYDTTADTQPPAAQTTTTVPAGPASELLPAMLAEVQGLAQRVMNADGDGDSATRIEQLWAAVKPEVESNEPDLVSDFEFVVRRCRAAADRNRPADADRAFKNLTTLVQAYLA